ncbi:protein sax-3 [Teleopsis dalmanni]|uniref:protein sax-3 n=1 Tax=Teleopsis dalmanni TaxID=139649 RepID=UPI0018CCD41A|nr:protein sax-3 [Teleopsis dalmanni]
MSTPSTSASASASTSPTSPTLPTITTISTTSALRGTTIVQSNQDESDMQVVNSRRETDAGVYWCEAKNELGVARSRNATLQVAVLRDEFRLEPQNTRIGQGDTVLLECAAPRGVPEPTVTWKKNGQKLDLDGSKRIRIVDGGNLAIQDTRQNDEGQYQCIAKNPVGVRESAVATLKVHVKPFIIRGPNDQTVLEGSSVTFPCRVGGDPMPDVLWLRSASGGNMPLERVSVLEDRSLRLERVTVADEGEYSCEADNVVGEITATGILTVFAPPRFIQRPTSKSVELGADTSFECRAGGNPRPTIYWTIKNNRTIIFPGAPPLDRFQSINTDEGHSVLTLTNFQRTDKDLVVVCNAMNEVATITARAQLTLHSQEDRPPPIIIAGPVNQTLPVKSLATLQCKAIGLPNPTISWYRDGIPVHPNAKINITTAGDLIISDLDRKEDQGLYTCVASSRTGKSTWSGYLRIEVPTNPNIKFYRAPEQSKCPTAPGQPKVLNASATALTIVWPTSDKAGASPLLGYTVEMYSTNKSKTWIPIASRLTEPIFTVDGLTNGAAYMFIVRAENTHGFSPPSPISEPITAGKLVGSGSGIGSHFSLDGRSVDILLAEVEMLLQTSDIVEMLEANATDSTTVRLAWDIDSGQYIEGFYIYARELHSAEYKMMTVLNAGGGATACSFNGLDKASTYEFFLMPFYKSVIGKPSNAKYARTQDDIPESPPHGMEAIQFNRTSVFLKWLPPHPNKTRNGILTSYNVIVRGLDSHNTTRIFKNMTIDAATPTLLLANLTTGVTYYIAVAAATKMGVGPFSKPAVLRMDPRTQSLDTGYTRYPINRELADDFLTQTWFIVLLGSIIAIIVFLFGALVLFKRYQFIKQTSLGSLHGNHAIGSVRKFPTLPLNANGVWIDPTGGVWRQATTCTTKEQLPDYAQVTAQQTLPLPDYERLTPLNMPDYAEVACSTFKNPNDTINSMAAGGIAKPVSQHSAKIAKNAGMGTIIGANNAFYDSCDAYATTTLVAKSKLYQNRYAASGKANHKIQNAIVGTGTNNMPVAIKTARQHPNNGIDCQQDDYQAAVIYSAPPSAYYGGMEANLYGNSSMGTPVMTAGGMLSDKMTASTASTVLLTATPTKINNKKSQTSSLPMGGNKINITENKMDLINKINRTSTTSSTSSATSGTTISTSVGSNSASVESAAISSSAPRLNPFNAATNQRQIQQQHQQQQLLVASNALKQGLGTYANTTLAVQMINGGGAGTLRRQRNPKIFKSENNIDFGNQYNKSQSCNNSSNNSPLPARNATNIGSHFDFLTNTTDVDTEFLRSSNSTNQLLNEWASSSSIAADNHQFGNTHNSKQHLYVKSKDGVWSAVSSDSYQNYKQQQQEQEPHRFKLAGDSTISQSQTRLQTHLQPQAHPVNSTLDTNTCSPNSSDELKNNSPTNNTANANDIQAGNKAYFSSFGQSDNV